MGPDPTASGLMGCLRTLRLLHRAGCWCPRHRLARFATPSAESSHGSADPPATCAACPFAWPGEGWARPGPGRVVSAIPPACGAALLACGPADSAPAGVPPPAASGRRFRSWWQPRAHAFRRPAGAASRISAQVASACEKTTCMSWACGTVRSSAVTGSWRGIRSRTMPVKSSSRRTVG